MKVETVVFNCFGFIVYLSISPMMHAQRTSSVMTSELNAISFSKTKSTSSYKLYDRYCTKFYSICPKKFWM